MPRMNETVLPNPPRECPFIQQQCPGIENAVKDIERLRTVFIEAARLIHSGYDGPFMGEAISDLVKAVLKVEMGE